MKEHGYIEYLPAIIAIAVFSYIYVNFQPQIIAGNGYGWDGLEYSKIFRKLSVGVHGEISFPFCQRVGTPFLASLINAGNEFSSFKLVNLLFSFAFSLVIYLIARASGFNYYYSMLSLSLTLIPFFSPLRFTPYYPVYTDPAFLALLSLSFLFLIRNQFGIAFIFLVIAYPFREATIYIAPLFLLFALYLGEIKKITFAKFALAFLGMVGLKMFIAKYMECNGSQLLTAITWLRRGLSDPLRFISWSAGISMTAAPLIYMREISDLSKVQKISIVSFVVAAVLCFLGGSDSTRIFYSFFPIYFLLIISVIQARGYIFSIFCMIGYLITNRFSEKILQPLNYLPSKDESGLFWQFPDHARAEVALMILCTWMILFICFDKLVQAKGSHPKCLGHRGQTARQIGDRQMANRR